jgi:hypothetical protein
MKKNNMNKFLGTVILVLIASFMTGFLAELKEHMREKRTGVREFSIKQNFGFATLVYTVIAIII